MKVTNRLTVLIAGGLLAAGCSTSTPAESAQDSAPVEQQSAVQEEVAEVASDEGTTRAKLEQAVAGEHRSEQNRARDAYRHPVETLLFFGLEPSMTVVELSPGAGWYTEILAPVLREQGKLVIGNAVPTSPDSYVSRLVAALQASFEAHPEVFDQVEVGKFSLPEHVELGEENSADLVVSFRSVHGWVNNGIAEQAFGAVYEVLKPGGTFGLVAHRAAEGADPVESAKAGYLPEAYVIELAEAAGFELVARSEINANPKDTRDHEHGVWSLLPSLRGGDTDREKFVEIGESDRMTLTFRKPIAE